MSDLDHKRESLLAELQSLGEVAVAFSGGVDSAVVAKAASLALGSRAVAVTADSASVPRQELADAQRLAAIVGKMLRRAEPTNAGTGDIQPAAAGDCLDRR